MYYIYLFLSFIKLDGFFPGAGQAMYDAGLSMFTKAEKKISTAIVQLEKSENDTKDQLERLLAEFQKRENKLNELRVNLVDTRVRSQKTLKKIQDITQG